MGIFNLSCLRKEEISIDDLFKLIDYLKPVILKMRKTQGLNFNARIPIHPLLTVLAANLIVSLCNCIIGIQKNPLLEVFIRRYPFLTHPLTHYLPFVTLVDRVKNCSLTFTLFLALALAAIFFSDAHQIHPIIALLQL